MPIITSSHWRVYLATVISTVLSPSSVLRLLIVVLSPNRSHTLLGSASEFQAYSPRLDRCTQTKGPSHWSSRWRTSGRPLATKVKETKVNGFIQPNRKTISEVRNVEFWQSFLRRDHCTVQSPTRLENTPQEWFTFVRLLSSSCIGQTRRRKIKAVFFVVQTWSPHPKGPKNRTSLLAPSGARWSKGK